MISTERFQVGISLTYILPPGLRVPSPCTTQTPIPTPTAPKKAKTLTPSHQPSLARCKTHPCSPTQWDHTASATGWLSLSPPAEPPRWFALREHNAWRLLTPVPSYPTVARGDNLCRLVPMWRAAGPPSPTTRLQDEFTLAAERPSARLFNDKTACVAKRVSVREQRSLDSIIMSDDGLLGMGDACCWGKAAALRVGVYEPPMAPSCFVLIYL